MRTFCLTLPETPERTAKARAHFRERGVKVEFFNGINAEVAGLATVHTYDVDNPGTNFRIGYKPTGIWLSHYMLWAALNLQPDDKFMILEVDAQFHDDWHLRTRQAMQDVPADFDMLFLGSCCCAGHKKTHIKGDIYKMRAPACFHCYVVARKALPKLLSLRAVIGPIDLQYGFELADKLSIYACLPRCVSQFNTEIPD